MKTGLRLGLGAQAQGPVRLELACLIVGTSLMVAPIFTPPGDEWVQFVGGLASFGLPIVERWQRWSVARLAAAAQVYMVVVAFLIAMLERPDPPFPSWVCVLIMALPLLLPGRARLPIVGCSLVGLVWGPVPAVFGPILAGLCAYALSGKPPEAGGYLLEKKLGQGGMGEVWKAHHTMLARPAAIKMIHPDTLSGDPDTAREILLRFQREARATAALRSPHTVSLYDFGLSDDGTFYYVMEFLDGMDLDTLVTQFGPVPPERAIHFLLQACDSLAEAHAVGLVHRDIKPANFYACRQGLEVDVVKLLDFGLVTPPPKEGDALKLTAPSTVFGTPAFMSPEQAGAEKTDARSDIYSLGCVAYWLLTGKLVFEGESMRTVIDLFTVRPKPPSEKALQQVLPDLDGLILECLAKEPAARPQSAQELAARLRSCVGSKGWTQPKALAWWEQHGL